MVEEKHERSGAESASLGKVGLNMEQSSPALEQKLFQSSVPGVKRSPFWCSFCNTPFHYPVQCKHSLNLACKVLISN